MSLEEKTNSSDNEWIVTSFTSAPLNFDPKSTFLENSSSVTSYLSNVDNLNESKTPENSNLIDKELNTSLTLNMSNSSIRLTSETLRVLSTINIDNLSFNQKFELLFNDVSMLKASAVQGILASTNFRFLAWMIFLDCIPMDKTKWFESIYQHRTTYEKIKDEICCDPHKKRSNSDLNVDHPLSQHYNSTWNRYFSHSQMKSVILQDVIRINRHNEFFNQESTLETIVNLLFIYVQLTRTEYRQGMHEILTSIMYVLHEEYTALTKTNETNESIQNLVKLEYLEHDTFTIFQAVMETMHEWFGTTKQKERSFNRRLSCPTLNGINLMTTSPRLFQEEDQFYESKIIHKINYITNVILKNNDIEIYNHLNEIDVSLCPFGIRWLRLLFTRELSFPSCLMLWDAIFATDCHDFSLVNYIFVALLTYLRDDLLKMDNSSCLKLLMQPHFYLETLEVLKTALYLQNPAIYARPSSMESSYEIINSNSHKNPTTPNKHNQSIKNRTGSFNRDRNNNPSHMSKPHHHHQHHKANEFNPVKISNKLELEMPTYWSDKSNKKEHALKLYSMQQMHHNVDLVIHTYINKITELQNENDLLRMKFNEMEDLCNRSSLKLNANITILQDEILKSNDICDDDTTLLALAGLKQVRDQLNPAFRFEEEEMILTDKKDKPIKYRKNQQHQMIQTLHESSSSNSSVDLSNNQGEEEINNKPIKRRFSLFMKKAALLKQESKTTDEIQSIGGRLRSFSLLNTSTTDFLSAFLSPKTKSTQDIKNNQDDSTSLDDDNNQMDVKNLKLVLNDEKISLLDNNKDDGVFESENQN